MHEKLQYKNLRQRVKQRLLAPGRENKYRKLWFGIQVFKFTCFIRGLISIGRFAEVFYVILREIDDIGDGDTGNFTQLERVAIIKRTLQSYRHPNNPRNELEWAIRYLVKLGARLPFSYQAELEDIVQSILFDAERLYSGRVYTAAELEEHFFPLDSRGTVRLTAKLYREEAERYTELLPLAQAVRIYYNVRDYPDDVAKGQINIPIEELTNLGIGRQVLMTSSLDSVKPWFRSECSRGLKLLRTYRATTNFRTLHWITKLTLWLVYERQAQRFFERRLAKYWLPQIPPRQA